MLFLDIERCNDPKVVGIQVPVFIFMLKICVYLSVHIYTFNLIQKNIEFKGKKDVAIRVLYIYVLIYKICKQVFKYR